MAKWKVNKERINTDIPDENGNVVGGAVTYPTKRLIVDAKKKISSQSTSENFYIKESLSPEYRETQPLPEKSTEERESEVQLAPIPNYKGIGMNIGLSPYAYFEHAYTGIDSDFNVGLNIDGYTNPTTYKVPHISFGINTFYRIDDSRKTFGQADIYTPTQYVNEMLAGYQERPTVKRYRVFKECYASYVCYPLITGEGKYNVFGSTVSNMTNLSRNVDLNLTNIYDVLTFSAAEESGFKLASWHFHIKHINKSFYKFKLVDSTKTGKERYSFYGTKETDPYRRPITIGNSDEALVMFFEYRKSFIYPQDGETANPVNKQKLWPSFDNNAIILVRRLVRNEKGEVLKNSNGEYQWKLCVHALSDVNYTLKTWKISDGSFDQITRFFNDEILKNVIEFDTEELDKICDDDYHFWVCNRFYAEEISDGDISGDSYDESNYTLIQKDVLLEQEYRTYNELESEEWKKVKSEVSECVDDTTCKLFKDYSQQILPSTTIVKGMKCDVSEPVVSDEFVRSLETQKVNVSEWQTEIIGIKENEFVKAFFKVYFDDLDGNNISTVEYIINNKTEYERFLNGMLDEKPVLNYPQIDGESVPFWYMSSNRSFVESGLELSDAYRYGMGYNMVDIVKHTGVHFLPFIEPVVYYTGNDHFTSNGLTMYGLDYLSGVFNPCLATNGEMAAIASGIQDDGQVIVPIIDWKLTTFMYAAFYGGDTPASTYIKIGDEFVTLPRIVDLDVIPSQTESYGRFYGFKLPDEKRDNIDAMYSFACFGIGGKESETRSWSGGGTGIYCAPFDNLPGENNDIIAFIRIYVQDEFANVGWDFHTTFGAQGVLINPNGDGKIHLDVSRVGATDALIYDTNDIGGDELESGMFYTLYRATVAGVDKVGIRKVTDNDAIYLNNQQYRVQSKSMMKNNKFQFYINVPEGRQETAWIERSVIENAGTIINDNEKIIDSHLTDNIPGARYTFKKKCILSIDNDIEKPKIFNIDDEINMAYYSGCTFIEYNR